jgi:RND family efflux transporter MFP subunit
MLQRLLSRLVTLLLVSAIAAGLWWTYTTPATASAPAEVRPHEPLVRTVAVEPADAQVQRTFHGVTQAADAAALAFPQGGRLTAVGVEVGQRLEAGDVIATLDAQPLRNAVQGAVAQVDELTAQREQIERDLSRAQSLLQSELGTEAAVEQNQATLQRLDAAIAGARTQLQEARRVERETTLRAPWAGTVTEVMLQPGEVAAPGTPIIMLSGQAGLEVRFDVPENVISQLREEQPVTVSFPIAGIPEMPAQLTRVTRAGSVTGGLFAVTVVLSEDAPSGLVAGMRAQVQISLDAPGGLQVPVAAVVSPTGENAQVWVVRDNIAQAVPVQPLRMVGDDVVVQGDFLPGDQVIEAGVHRVAEGMTVRIAEQ